MDFEDFKKMLEQMGVTFKVGNEDDFKELIDKHGNQVVDKLLEKIGGMENMPQYIKMRAVAGAFANLVHNHVSDEVHDVIRISTFTYLSMLASVYKSKGESVQGHVSAIFNYAIDHLIEEFKNFNKIVNKDDQHILQRLIDAHKPSGYIPVKKDDDNEKDKQNKNPLQRIFEQITGKKLEKVESIKSDDVSKKMIKVTGDFNFKFPVSVVINGKSLKLKESVKKNLFKLEVPEKVKTQGRQLQLIDSKGGEYWGYFYKESGKYPLYIEI